MMRLAWVIAPGLVLAACQSGPPAPPLTPDQIACRRGVYNDRTVKDILEKSAGNASYQVQHAADLERAKSDAETRCLQLRGVIRPGGVERVKPT